MLPTQASGRRPLIGFYALYFGTTGIVLPFLPAYLKSLTLSVSQVGLLLSLGPLLALGAPHFWGHLADRFGRPNRVLSFICAGACVGFLPLFFVDRFPTLVATLAAYAFFASSITPLIDSLALQHIAQNGGSYSHLRLFGSLGFVLSATLFGLTVDSVGRTTLLAAFALLTALTLWSFTLRDSRSLPARRPVHPLAGLQLLADRELRWLLAACALHWIACAPYHGTFSIFVGSLGLPPSVVGIAMGLGVAAEVVVLLLYPRLADRISPRDLLVLAFTASTLRWAGLSLATSRGVIVGLSLLHGLSFGAFYVASIAIVVRRVPPHLRASGQGLFAAITFGIGGLVGYSSAGAGYDWLGGHRLFAVAAVLDLAAAALILRITPQEPRLPA
ncbi:MFS transporter [Archangium lansingense]|uniref:MFS transporter n=1 Tax=Archangium lansingense TaxID=2995310 RepID=A0ABT4A675_9BACT|nr:MFS transporter [Archangium lansinium]MCY1077150.1 MFS transporter [Archangium lansinium]